MELSFKLLFHIVSRHVKKVTPQPGEPHGLRSCTDVFSVIRLILRSSPVALFEDIRFDSITHRQQ